MFLQPFLRGTKQPVAGIRWFTCGTQVASSFLLARTVKFFYKRPKVGFWMQVGY